MAADSNAPLKSQITGLAYGDIVAVWQEIKPKLVIDRSFQFAF